MAVHGHPCGRPPEERNGPGLFRVSQRPWKVKAAGRFFQRRVKAGPERPVHFSLEAACTMGERRPDPRKQWDERGRRVSAGGGSPLAGGRALPRKPPAGAGGDGRGARGEPTPLERASAPGSREAEPLPRGRERVRIPALWFWSAYPSGWAGGRKNRAADTAGCV